MTTETAEPQHESDADVSAAPADARIGNLCPRTQ